jgi:hypothetical protein
MERKFLGGSLCLIKAFIVCGASCLMQTLGAERKCYFCRSINVLVGRVQD